MDERSPSGYRMFPNILSPPDTAMDLPDVLPGPAGAKRIRATHPYAFRSGEWARLVGTMDDPETGRRCYSVAFDDGATDWWPVDDKAHGYEFSPEADRG